MNRVRERIPTLPVAIPNRLPNLPIDRFHRFDNLAWIIHEGLGMMATRASSVAANSFDYWQDGHGKTMARTYLFRAEFRACGQNGRKSAASALSGPTPHTVPN